MNIDDAEALLESMRPRRSGVRTSLGRRDGTAYLRLENESNPDRWIDVFTPGDRWFALQTEGRYALDHFEEDTPDEDVQKILKRYVDVGVAYASGFSEIILSNKLRFPILVVHVGDARVELTQPVSASIAFWFRRLTGRAAQS